MIKRKKPELLECLNKRQLDKYELDIIMMDEPTALDDTPQEEL